MKSRLLGVMILFCLFVIAACSSQEEEAENYPSRDIRLIVPWDAGGDTDAINRIIAEELEQELDTTVVVENIPGGSGVVGAQQALQENNDGYTLVAIHDSVAMSQLTGQADFGYFDFEPISLMTSTYQMVATNPNNPWDSMEDVVADANENPGEISYGASVGSTSQLEPALIQTAADIEFNIVGFDGTANRMQAIVANDIDLGSVSVPAGKDYLEDDRMKLLGYTGEERHEDMPDIPTLQEQGIDVVNATNRGIAVPKDTPEEIVSQLNEALENVANSESFQERIKSIGTDVNFLGTGEYIEFLENSEVEMQESLEQSGLLNN